MEGQILQVQPILGRDYGASTSAYGDLTLVFSLGGGGLGLFRSLQSTAILLLFGLQGRDYSVSILFSLRAILLLSSAYMAGITTHLLYFSPGITSTTVLLLASADRAGLTAYQLYSAYSDFTPIRSRVRRFCFCLLLTVGLTAYQLYSAYDDLTLNLHCQRHGLSNLVRLYSIG
jgi:hypothetical protein